VAILDSLTGHARALASTRPAQLIELTGTLRDGAENISALYAGNGSNLDYLTTLLFASTPERSTVDKVFPLFLRGAIDRQQRKSDVLLVERPPLWGALGGAIGDIRMPAWVRQELDLKVDAATRWTLGRHLEREVDRQIRRHSYRLELNDTARSKDEFFESFYLPYIRSRHGTAAITVDREKFAAVAATATLAQLFAGETCIAGMLLQWKRDALKFGWFGSRENPPPRGASEVLDVLCMKMAADRGIRRIHFGNSRPSLADGVVRYKRKFGADCILPRYPQTMIEVRLRTDRPALRQWLAAQQFLCKVGDSLQVADYVESTPAQLRFRPAFHTD
jgi:hypothetical protein